jgi:hypothetical protein
MDDISSEATVLSLRVRAHQALLSRSALRRVPLEILAEICYQASANAYYWFDIHEGPWSFSQVCRRWRDASLFSCPSWSNLFIDVSLDSYSTQSQRIHNMLPAMVDRSGAHGINMNIYIEDEGATTNIPLIQTILGHSDRFHSLDFVIYDPRQIDLLQARKGHFGSLRSLRISMTEEDTDEETLPQSAIYDVFAHAPRLKDLSLDSFNTGFFHHWNFPWSNLETVNLTRLHHLDLLAVAAKIRNAQELTFSEIWSSISGTTPTQTAILPRVQRLHVTRKYNTDVLFLPLIKCPALVHIEFECFKIEYDYNYFIQMVHDSGCSITTIIFCDWDKLQDASILKFVQSIPTAENLVLRRGEEVKNLHECALFSALSNDTTCCPLMKSLALENVLVTEGLGSVLGSFITLVESRTLIETVTVSFYSYEWISDAKVSSSNLLEMSWWNPFCYALRRVQDARPLSVRLTLDDNFCTSF